MYDQHLPLKPRTCFQLLTAVFLAVSALFTTTPLLAQETSWAKSGGNGFYHNNNDMGVSIVKDASGNTYATGTFTGTTSFGNLSVTSPLLEDIFIAKYDAAGTLLWVKSLPGNSSAYPTRIAVDATGIYLAGDFYQTTDFDPSAATANLSAGNFTDIFMAKYDLDGNYLWAKSLSGASYKDLNDMVISATGIFLTGYIQGTVDFDPSAATANLSATGNNTAYFIARYDLDGNYTWAKTISGNSSSTGIACLLNNSDLYVTGYFSGTADFDPSAATDNRTSAGNHDIFVIRYDLNGNYGWVKTIGGTGNDQSMGLAKDATGFYMTGNFNGTVDFDPSAVVANLTANDFRSNVFIARYDFDGNYTWAKNMNTTGQHGVRRLIADATGIYLAGYFNGTVDFDPSAATANLVSVSSYYDGFIARYTQHGDYAWAKSMGGTDQDEVRDVFVDANAVHFTGSFSGTVDFDPSTATANLASAGGMDIFIASYDLSGSYLSAKQYGNGLAISEDSDAGVATARDGNGNVYVVGIFSGVATFGNITLTSKGGYDVYIAKYDASGAIQWAKGFGASSRDMGKHIVVNTTGVYVTGYFVGTVDFDPSAATANLTAAGTSNDIFLAKYDLNGNYLWAKGFGAAEEDIGYGLALSTTHLYLTGGFGGTVDFDPSFAYAGLSSSGATDIVLAKYDLNGNYVWAKRAGGSTDYDEGYSVAVDATGVYMTGYFSYTTDFDPSENQALLTASGRSDAFIARYDLNGNYLWARGTGNDNSEFGYGVAVDATGVYMITNLVGTVDFDPSAAVANLTSAGSSNGVIVKYSLNGNYTWAKSFGGMGGAGASSIATDGTHIYFTGGFSGTADFDPSAAVANLTAAGGGDIYIAKYDQNGNYVWAKRSGGAGNEGGRNISVGGSDIFITGSFEGSNINFASAACTPILLTSSGGTDAFVAKYTKQNPTVTVSAPTVAATTVLAGTSDVVIYTLRIDSTVPNNLFTGLSLTTAGNYAVTDFAPNGFKLRYSTDATLSVTDFTLATQSAVAPGGTLVFNGFSQNSPVGSVYVFVTANVASSAANDRTIQITATPLSGVLICGAVMSGTSPLAAGGVQTITNTVYANASMAASGNGLSAATAKKTIAEAVALAPENLNVHIAAGSYAETVTVAKNLTFTSTGIPQVQQLVMNGAGKTLAIHDTVGITTRLSLQGGTVASNSNLMLLSTASQTAMIDDFSTGYTGTITGNIIAQRYIGSTGTHYVSTPVSGVRAGDFGQYQMASYYNEPQVTAASTSIDAGWMNIANSTIIDPIKGLSALYDPARTVNLTGTANTGNLSTTVTRTNSGNFTGFNVIGNPYPSPVRWSVIWNLNNNDNIHKTVYVWNNSLNRSAAYNFATNTSANGGSDEIAQGQAFRIRVNTIGYSTTFSLNNSVRMTTSSNNFLRKEAVKTSEKLRLVLSSSTNKEGYETVIHSVDDATAGIDAAYDGEFIADKGVDVIYSKAENTNLTINALPELKGERTVALGVEVQAAGMYTISATEIEHFAPATAIYLEDRKLGKLVDLAKESSYTVHLNRSEANRFFVHFNSTAKQEAASTSFVNVYAEDGEVTVQFSDIKAAKGMIAIVNMLGETVAEISNEQQVAKLRVNQPAGTYLVRIASDQGLTVKKVVLD